jgi:hypothetical protein
VAAVEQAEGRAALADAVLCEQLTHQLRLERTLVATQAAFAQMELHDSALVEQVRRLGNRNPDHVGFGKPPPLALTVVGGGELVRCGCCRATWSASSCPRCATVPCSPSAVSFLGDAKSSLGDAKSSLGDAKSSLGDAGRNNRLAPRAVRCAAADLRAVEWAKLSAFSHGMPLHGKQSFDWVGDEVVVHGPERPMTLQVRVPSPHPPNQTSPRTPPVCTLRAPGKTWPRATARDDGALLPLELTPKPKPAGGHAHAARVGQAAGGAHVRCGGAAASQAAATCATTRLLAARRLRARRRRRARVRRVQRPPRRGGGGGGGGAR